MEAKKIITIVFLLLSFVSFAQSIDESRIGYLRAQANIAAGYMFAQKDIRPYIAGDFDLFVDDRVSVTGEGWFGFKVNNRFVTGLMRNHSIFGGLNYHLMKNGKWDPYIGLSPGIAFTQAFVPCHGNCTLEAPDPDSGVVPLVSGVLGCNYYIGSVFNLFVKFRGVAGRFRGNLHEFTQLNEIKISVGLGWNVRLRKRS